MIAKHLPRIAVYAVLLFAALFFLAPLYVMLATSLKDADQIRAGNLLSLPTSINFESWKLAWSTACTGVDCRGLRPYFWNSVSMQMVRNDSTISSVELSPPRIGAPEYALLRTNCLMMHRQNLYIRFL